MAQRLLYADPGSVASNPHDTHVPFDTGSRILEIKPGLTHEFPEGYRDIGETLRIGAMRITVGDEHKNVDFSETDLYRFVVDPTSGKRIYKAPAVAGSRFIITNDGAYPLRYQLDGVYNKESGLLLVTAFVVNNNTDKVITIDKLIVNYKE